MVLAPLLRIICLYVCQGLFLGYLFCFTDLYVCLYAIHATQFWSLELCSKFSNQEMWDLQLCYFLRLFLLFRVHWDSIWILGWIESVYHFEEYWHLNSMKSSSPFTWEVFPPVDVFFNFFQQHLIIFQCTRLLLPKYVRFIPKCLFFLCNWKLNCFLNFLFRLFGWWVNFV